MRELLSSRQNPKVKLARSLSKNGTREETGLFLIEGYRELLHAVNQDVEIETLFISPSFFLKNNEPALIDKIDKTGAQIVEVIPPIFDLLSYRDRPDGLLAIAKQKKSKFSDFTVHDQAIFVIAEGFEKPGNLGTLLRTMDAIGADGLILIDSCTDLFNPNVVRSSIGCCFTVTSVQATIEDACSWLRENQIALVAATPHAELPYYQAPLNKKIAIALGCEQYGLSKELVAKTDLSIRIPMCGQADSLNVATAGAVILFEALRQRVAPN